MPNDIREAIQSPLVQGVDEQISYTLTTTPWGSSPGSLAVVVKNEAGTDVTSTVMPSGSPTAVGDVITLPALKSLTAGTTYRVEVRFTCGGNVFEAFFRVTAET
jgi:hypothetical protein